MRPFLDDDFLLSNETAKALYHGMAEQLPILDYHCHVSPKEIAENRLFYNLTQLWLEGDHYKWRLMRANGVEERYITGGADDFEKFAAWAGTLERAVANPLYHWSHLELYRYFGYAGHLTAANAAGVWDFCGKAMEGGMSVRDILKRSNVTMLCTTDDPVDTLEWHARLTADIGLETQVLPSFRPDKAVNLEKDGFAAYIAQLGAVAGVKITGWTSLIQAIRQRLDYFAAHGCVLADHGLDNIRYFRTNGTKLDDILKRRLAGASITEEEMWQYKAALLHFCGEEYARRGWVMQLHFAAQRDNNAAMFRTLGQDTGYDCIGPGVNLPDLAAFMDGLERKGMLPKVILYSLNPNDNAALVTLMGCFHEPNVRGKIQHGSAWWFNDHKDGMEAQISTLAANGLLGNFIGMLTDSRSFLSYTRHEYFRRILCNLLGDWAEKGVCPDDRLALERLVADISYWNSVQYFGMERHYTREAEMI